MTKVTKVTKVTNVTKVIAILATLDTKGEEARYVQQQLEQLGSRGLLVDLGVLGSPAVHPDIAREDVAHAGGTALADLLRNPSREQATPVIAAGATKLLGERLARGELHGLLGLGGLQGTALCTQIMRAMPYGLPKVMVSTVASGDTRAYVDVKDVTMAFSVGDILGLNAFTRRILANAAGAVHGMALVELPPDIGPKRPLVGMTNLGVLTQGAIHALECLRARGYEAIVFHAVGSGGRAMEQMMREGILGGVLDYALGEITDQLFDGLRAGGDERLTVAGKLGLPQVLCPGGVEHVGILVAPNTVPPRWRDHAHLFHSPVVLAPRLWPQELIAVADEIARRLQHTRGDAVMMLPEQGTSRYAMPGGPLRDAEGDAVFFARLKARLPASIEVVARATHAEDPAFVEEAVARLVAMMQARAAR